MKYAILALVLLSQPALAGAMDDLEASAIADDVECSVVIDTHWVVYTYNSQHQPAVMPVDGMTCVLRDYDAEAASFKEDDQRFEEQWAKRAKPTGN